jgi:hypothetical protein
MAYEHFEQPTVELLNWLEENLSFYEKEGNEKAVACFRSLLEDAQQKANIITRSASMPIPRDGAFMTQIERVCASRKIDAPEPPVHLGFLRMLDPDYQAHVSGTERKAYSRLPIGFSEMLDAAFPHSTKLDDNPRGVHRGTGFLAMLEGAANGT